MELVRIHRENGRLEFNYLFMELCIEINVTEKGEEMILQEQYKYRRQVKEQPI